MFDSLLDFKLILLFNIVWELTMYTPISHVFEDGCPCSCLMYPLSWLMHVIPIYFSWQTNQIRGRVDL